MTWRKPTPFEKSILKQVQSDTPDIILFASHLILAQRIEPLLLRNIRMEFLPQLQAEVESMLWFSPIVAARSNHEIVLHHGIASELARNRISNTQDTADFIQKLWAFTCKHTRHWNAADRLERDLRYQALIDDQTGITSGLQEILRQLHTDISEDERLELSRLVKRSMLVISHKGQTTDEARILAQYASLALGDGNNWIDPGKPRSLPKSLADRIPTHIAISRLSVEVHEDAQNGQVLQFTIAEGEQQAIHFNAPLPTRLHIKPKAKPGKWHSITKNTRIKINPPNEQFLITTLEGKQWTLKAEPLITDKEKTTSSENKDLPPLILSYFEADERRAQEISRWLDDRQIPYQLFRESAQSAYVPDPHETSNTRMVRVWSRNAEKYWQANSMSEANNLTDGLFLRVDDIELPEHISGRASVLEWPRTNQFETSEKADLLQHQLEEWISDNETEVSFEQSPEQSTNDDINSAAYAEDDESSETQALTVWLSWDDDEESMWSIREQLENNKIQCIDNAIIPQQKMMHASLLDDAIIRADAVFVLHHPDTLSLAIADKRIEEANTARKYSIPVFHITTEERIRPSDLYFHDETIIPLEQISALTNQQLSQHIEESHQRLNYQRHDQTVLISYAHQDQEITKTLSLLLEEEGWEVWTDFLMLAAGESWAEEMDELLNKADCIVSLWSENSTSSDTFKQEFETSTRLDKSIAVRISHQNTFVDELSSRNREVIDFTTVPLRSKETRSEIRRNIEYKKLLAAIARVISIQQGINSEPSEGDSPVENSESEFINEQKPEEIQMVEDLSNPSIPPEKRLEIGDALAKIGDPRHGVGLDAEGLPDIDWVKIPGGGFLYGEEKQTMDIDSFYMARYPITNEQYDAFIKDGGYADERWWKGLAEQIKKPEKPDWAQPNRPRESVSWYEAIAFCRWLSERLGYEVILPTEIQWERAARGTDGREYPWGDDYQSGYANVDEKEKKVGPYFLNQTSAVGMYAFAASPEGIQDLSGNVWEWCLNKYYKAENTSMEDKEPRVLDGGSWVIDPDFARASSRNWYYPDDRNYDLGFRVVCSSPISR